MRLLILILAIVSGGLAWLWWSQHRAAAPMAWQGYAEADYVKVAPVQAGMLTAVTVSRGEDVPAGAPLFAQDDTVEAAARDQAAGQLAQASELLANLQAGGKATEIAQADANLADLRASVTRIQADLRRAEILLRDGNTTQQSVDQLRADYRSASARMQAAEQASAQARAPLGRAGEIKAQLQAVEAARAALDMAEHRLAQRKVAAPIAGRIADVLAQQGETVQAGMPVVSILAPENIFVRFFVPETALALLHPGDTVALACDHCPADLKASVSFIAPQAEYTPPVIYSEATKSKLVFLIEARLTPAQAALLNPGLPVSVRPAEPSSPVQP